MTKKIFKNKKIQIVVGVLAVVLLGAGLYAFNSQKQAEEAQKTDQERLQEEEKQAGERDPKTESEAYQRQQNQATAKENGSASTSSGSNSNSGGAANPTITSAGQSGDMIYVNAIVDNQTNGTCTLVASKNGSTTVTRTAALGLVTSYYACQGFNVERSAFGSAGEWSVVVKFSNGSTSGQSEARKVSVQ